MSPAAATRVGVLHPGEMGASVGAALVAGGATVSWASDGRSDATRRRAVAAALVAHVDLAELVADSEVVVSVCPPGAAVEVARAVAAEGFGGVYVDANAVAPATSRRIGGVVAAGGAGFVDGAIVGGPPAERGQTRLFLSGPRAGEVAALFERSVFETVVLGDEVGAASAVKVAYAAWTKGSAALLLAVRAFARAEGVDGALLDEWARSQPNLEARSSAFARTNARKAWRFVTEMDEGADAFATAGVPEGFARAAARTYERLCAYRDVDTANAESVFDAIRRTTS